MKIRLIITNNKEVVVTRSISDYSRYFTYPELESDRFDSLQDLIQYRLDQFVNHRLVQSVELLDMRRSHNEEVVYCKILVAKLPEEKKFKLVKIDELDHYLLPSSYRVKL